MAEAVESVPDQAYLRMLAQEALEDAVDGLLDGQLEVLFFQAVDGCTFAETDELLEISINTTRS